MLFLRYALSRWRPLRGSRLTVFKLSAVPLFLILFLLNIGISVAYLPDFMGALAAGTLHASQRGRSFLGIVTTTTLPMLALWMWHRVLLLTQPKSQTDLTCDSQLSPDQLRADKIELQTVNGTISDVLLFRPKEFRAISEYFFIVLNGTVVAALKPGEYTKVRLQREMNEIGCYAKASNDSFDKKLRLNSCTYTIDRNKPTAIVVTPDIFSGSLLKEIERWTPEIGQSYKVLKYTIDRRPH